MGILMIHHILEFHQCRLDPGTFQGKIESCLKKNKLTYSSPLRSWQEGEVLYLMENNQKYLLLLQYHSTLNTLLCDFQVNKNYKGLTRLFTDIKKAVDSLNFTSLEIKRGLWDRDTSGI